MNVFLLIAYNWAVIHPAFPNQPHVFLSGYAQTSEAIA